MPQELKYNEQVIEKIITHLLLGEPELENMSVKTLKHLVARIRCDVLVHILQENCNGVEDTLVKKVLDELDSTVKEMIASDESDDYARCAADIEHKISGLRKVYLLL